MEFIKEKAEINKEEVRIKEVDFNLEYDKIFNVSQNTVLIKTEWTKVGDYFEKLSLYDNSYSTISTFGNTTLIK